ncbi:Ig-like domain-containing protein [Haloferula sp. A504]|uniref:Ig-like domain-containing protein n=1 Tax=Haloferula sp. A504 TaxID=3373601 RepID=UPI0031C60A83|nr:Ig-like domain-containing protein [Verrucomicrobiaceae bacterium E54]
MNLCLPLIVAAAFSILHIANGQVIPLPVVNGDFETDADGTEGATGWTIQTGGTATHFWTSAGLPELTGALDPDTGQGGSGKFLSPNRTASDPDTSSNPASSFASQSIDLSTWAAVIDTAAVRLGVSFYYSNGNFPEERSVVSVEFFDGSAGSLGVVTTGDLPETADGGWSVGYVGGGAIAVPPGARSFVITLNQRRQIGGIIYGTATNAAFDSVTASMAVSPGTPGFDFLVDASQDDGLDQVWEELTPGNPTGQELLVDDSPAVNHVAVSGSVTAFTHAYDFPGGQIDNEGGALLVAAGTTTSESFPLADNGAWNVSPLTMEIWFKPDALTDTADNGQILFETGGTNGLGLFLNDNILYLSNDSGSNQITYDLATDPDGVLLDDATNEFIHAAFTVDTNSPFENILYINGRAVGTANDNGNWSGNDGSAFGTRGGANAGGLGGGQADSESFNGQIALIRAYYDDILELDEIQANFLAYAPDVLAPYITATGPADDSLSANPPTFLTATFNENIALTGSGTITITDTVDGTGTTIINLPDTGVSVSSNVLTIDPGSLEPDTSYEVTITDTAIEDTAGNGFAGVAAGEWNFTADATPPTLDSFANNKPGGQIYDNDSVTYTVTFSEPMTASTVEASDFSAIGTAGATVDSLTSVSDSIYELVVTPTSTGTIQLQVNASENLEDLVGNALDTSSAIQDPTVIDVIPFAANSADFTLGFQQTVASEEFVDQVDPIDNPWGDTTPGRFYHISVNPNNAGYGAYIALDTDNSTPIPPFTRTFSDPVVGWSFIGGGPNNILTISQESGGFISWTTTDTVFDAFGMNQRKFWINVDPGPDFNLPADEAEVAATTHDAVALGYRSFGQATATMDVSTLVSGTAYIFYGAFSDTPVVDAVLRDSSGLEPDISLPDLHTNADFANRTEYYVAEVAFDTDGGKYDTIVYNYSQPSGNGRSAGIVLTGVSAGPGPVASFDISPISSPQIVGEPISGITITAKDASDQVATGFTGTVDFGGTGGFSGTSASFVDGVLSGVSVTPTVAGSDLTFTVTDSGGASIGTATITKIRTIFEDWSGGLGFDVDTNGDGIKNGMAFLLGAPGPNADATSLLPEVSEDGGDLVLTFSMLKPADRGTAAMKVEWSSDLGISDLWSDNQAIVPDTTPDPQVPPVDFTIDDSGALNAVTARISSGEAVAGKLFGRLQAAE